ncbi:MAG: hypothetical protein ACYC2U_03425 [Candidatus Amoebophilus sp.]
MRMGKGVEQDYVKAKEWFQKAADQGEEIAQAWLKRVSCLENEEQKEASKEEEMYKVATDKQQELQQEESKNLDKVTDNRLEEILAPFKKRFGTKATQVDGTWQANIPLTEEQDAEDLTPTEQETLEQADNIIKHYTKNYCEEVQTLSRFSDTEKNASQAFSKIRKVVRDAIATGSGMNSLIQLQQEINQAYGTKIIKLEESCLEEAQQERLKDMEHAYLKRGKELGEKQEEIINELRNCFNEHRLSLLEEELGVVAQLEGITQEYINKLRHIEDPVQSALEDYYDWKRHVFSELVKSYLGNYLITYEALALGTVARHTEFYEHAAAGVTTIASIVGTALWPLGGGAVGNVAGKALELGASLYADRETRIKSARLGKLYGYRGVEGMVELTRNVADGLTYRLKDAVIDLTPGSLNDLARVAAIQMVDYALKEWDKDESKDITPIDLLLHGASHQPKWFNKVQENTVLKTEDDQPLDIWVFLHQGEQAIPDEGKFMKAARFALEQVRNNKHRFIEYGIKGAEFGVKNVTKLAGIIRR